jgi:hypothetical protein
MDDESKLDHFARGCLQIITHMIGQYPKHHMARVDKDKFLSAFSAVIGGTRVAAKPWVMGPGWSGEDTRIGKDMDGEELDGTYNTDSQSDTPFGNTEARGLCDEWAAHMEEWSKTIPLCMASDFSKVKDIGPNPNLRRSE